MIIYDNVIPNMIEVTLGVVCLCVAYCLVELNSTLKLPGVRPGTRQTKKTYISHTQTCS